MSSRALLSVILTVLTLVSVSGQKGVEDGSKYGHGEDSVRCIRSLSLAHESVRNKAYNDALQYWRIIFDECPQASKNIYLDGIIIYNELLEKEKNPARIDELVDTLMMVYDRRIEYYGQKGYVLGRKGVDLLRYRRDEIEDIQEAYGYLKEAVELTKSRPQAAFLATFMTATSTLFKNDVIDAKEVINNYTLISEVINESLDKRSNSKMEQLKDDIDELFAKSGAADCKVMEEIFTSKYNANSKDVDFLTNMLNLLDETDCKESELYYKASSSLHELKPSSLSASILAQMALSRGEYDNAQKYYLQAIELETDDIKKGEHYYSLAVVLSKLNKNSESREYALNAIKYKPNWGDPYLLIGNLYANSKDECGSLKLPNSIYWAAVDKFIKAKSVDSQIVEKANTLIETYSKYFPNKEEAFFQGINEGGSFEVGCWIKETTKARF